MMPHALQILEATEGGTRRHLRDLTLGLLSRGWRVTLAVSCGRDPDFARKDIPLFRGAGADVRVVPMSRGISPARDFAAFRALLALIGEVRPDVVHAHSSKAGFIGRAAAHFAHVPVFYTPHGFSFEMDVKAARRFFYRQLERLAAKWTDELIAVCEAEARAARGLSPRLEVATIHNGIDVEDFTLTRSARGLSPSARGLSPSLEVTTIHNGIDVGDFTGESGATAWPCTRYDAVFIGRICRQKAPEIFLAACERILEKRRAAKFAVMTAWNPAGTDLAIPDSLRGSVDILPGGGSGATLALLRSARMLAMPSRWEGFPYLVLEAMAAGTPVVASDVGGVGEAVRDGVEGLLVRSDDPAALAGAMERILSDPALAAHLAANARSRAGEYNAGKMIDAIAAEYSRISGERLPSGPTDV